MDNTCVIDECQSKPKARGMCNAHYKRWHRTGNALGIMPSADERFWSKVEKTDTCWNWIGSRHPRGYGQFYSERNGRKNLVWAHRESYVRHIGPIPEGLYIDHMCHNTSCVNPAHLRAVSQKQNIENQGSTRSDNKSGYRGVSWDKRRNSWRGNVLHNQRQVFVGYFSTAESANAAVVAKRLELFTHNDLDRA
jgi:hypothetical protein